MKLVLAVQAYWICQPEVPLWGSTDGLIRPNG
jgi:hypothetical protein